MTKKMLAIVACVALTTSGVFAGLSGNFFHKAPLGKITGDYVEARTASVFCGACHYNGEAVTTGKEALMAWSIQNGGYDGVDLRGLRAMAAISSQDNLGDDSAARKSEITIDSAASDQQVAAFVDLLKSKIGAKLGDIVAVHRAPVSFSLTDTGYEVEAADFATLSVQYRADNSCCVQPNLVWYEPLTPLEHRKVGFTEMAAYNGTVGDRWYSQGEDSAFYGAIAF